MTDTIILNLATQVSADDCRHCGLENVEPLHLAGRCRGVAYLGHSFEPMGWEHTVDLGLSLGCFWSYADSRMHWFDAYTLEDTVRSFVMARPYLVSFNGILHDFPLLRGLLRREADRLVAEDGAEMLAQDLCDLCDTFTTLCAASYDIWQAIWQVAPTRTFEPSLHSLDAISQVNGLGAQRAQGARARRDWRDGQYAPLIEYCQDAVGKTKALFDMICAGTPVCRGDGVQIQLPIPTLLS